VLEVDDIEVPYDEVDEELDELLNVIDVIYGNIIVYIVYAYELDEFEIIVLEQQIVDEILLLIV